MRRLRATCLLLTMVLLLSGCFKIDGKITINDDGSGNVDFLSALNTEALTNVLGDFDIPESELGGTEGLCSEFESDMIDADDAPPGATVTPYEEDGFCGSRVEFDLAPSTDHSASITDLFEEDARLYKEGDNWFFETGLNTDDLTEGTAPDDAMFDALFGEASFVITVDLPGRAIDGQNNATTVGSDGVFTWDIDILNPPSRLFAQTEPGSGGGTAGGSGGGFNPLLILGIVLLLAALGLAAYWFMTKNKGGSGSATPTTDGADGMLPTDYGQPAQLAGTMPVAGPPTSTMPAATMPVAGAPIAAAPPTASDMATDETVILSAQDLPTAAPAAAAVPTPPTEPTWDPARGAWILQDPARGLLQHDPATDTWNPA